MRVTTNVLMEQSLAAVRAAFARMGRSQRELATGRRINAPSDDPAGHAAATRLAARLAATEQFGRQATQAESALTATETLISRVTPLLARAEELAIGGADASRNATVRAGMAREANQFLEEAVAIANERDDGRYLLGGRETLTAPLTVTRDAAGDVTAVAWNPRGVDGAVEIAVAPGVSVQTNVGGTAALGDAGDPSSVFGLLMDLRDALAGGDPEAVRATIDRFAGAEARLGAVVAEVGSRLRTVRQASDDLVADRLATQTAMSAVLDADLAQVAASLSQQEVAYQAALAATARAVQPSLLEFLR
jgi:flagellar hook-associated protein 3 FlgL